jgi:hypothetical protein
LARFGRLGALRAIVSFDLHRRDRVVAHWAMADNQPVRTGSFAS